MQLRASGRIETIAAIVAGFLAIAVAAYLIWDAIIVRQFLRTDFSHHLLMLRKFQAGHAPLPGHFLFDLLTAAASSLLDLSAQRAAVVVMTASLVASAAIIFALYLAPPAKRQDLLLRLALTISALIVTAIFLPFFNRIYSGQSSPNVWHNPTTALLKPFALLSAIYLERILFGRPGTWAYAVLISSALFGLAAKPSFVLLLIPVLVVAAIVASLSPRWQFLPKDYLALDRPDRHVLLGIAVGLAVLVVIQGTYIFGGPRQIIVAPFAVWSRTSPFIPLSVFLAVAFPAAVTWLDWRSKVRLEGLALGWAFLAVAFCIRSIFAEAGDAMMHGNFNWPYQIALGVLFAFSVRSYYLHAVRADRSSCFWIASGLLCGHTASGLYYLYQVLALGLYL